MKTLEIPEFSLEEIKETALKIIRFAGQEKIWLFEGSMGAGKTAMIKQICSCLQVKDNVSSPTYTLVNEYETTDKQAIYHFDFYRIKHEAEALDIGVDEYFSSGNLCLIEWPSQIPSLLPQKHIKIEIVYIKENKRKVFVSISN